MDPPRPTPSDHPTIGYESRIGPSPRRGFDAAYHRAVGRVVIVFIALPLGTVSLLSGAACIHSALGGGFFQGSPLVLTVGVLASLFGSTVLGLVAYHSVRLFRSSNGRLDRHNFAASLGPRRADEVGTIVSRWLGNQDDY